MNSQLNPCFSDMKKMTRNPMNCVCQRDQLTLMYLVTPYTAEKSNTRGKKRSLFIKIKENEKVRFLRGSTLPSQISEYGPGPGSSKLLVSKYKLSLFVCLLGFNVA